MHESELKPHQLYHRCNLDDLAFDTTDDLGKIAPAGQLIGQPRAEQALAFGVGIEQAGYNIFALGDQGTGKHTFILEALRRRAGSRSAPSDICYVNNFDQRHIPRLLLLNPGQGKVLADEMHKLVEDVRNAMQAAVENEEYQNRAQSIAGEYKDKQMRAFEELRRKARERNLVALPTPGGLAFAPAAEGADEGLSQEEYEKLSDEEKQRIQANAEEMHKEAHRIAQVFPQWQREVREKQRAFNREVTGYAIRPLIDELKNKFADNAAVVDYLQAVHDDLIENVQELFPGRPPQEGRQQPQMAMQTMDEAGRGGMQNPAERRYYVNVLVDNGKTEGAPVVYEQNPTFLNLFGRVEHISQMGVLFTDFTLIRAGALHRANGGYLILDALKLVREPFAWEGLKRTLQSGRLKIESIGQMYSLVSTVMLEPEALPIKVKVVLTGIPLLYYLLRHHDPDFGDLFKVSADFARQMDRTPENQQAFVHLMAGIVQHEKLLPFKKKALARVIERGSRLLEDGRKMSIHMQSMTDLLREADYWARQEEAAAVGADHVQKAVDARIFRSDRLRERMQEQIERDVVLIDTEGTTVGQINGLSVISLGDFAFGRPSRITARIRMGKGEVVDIEREVAMGGPIHSKGVLILSGFLGGRYALNHPLTLSASLVFEQSYGGIEGDSASSAELYALLSAIADVPIRQELAVTGSVNQHGRVQPIGGVNEKIEGFFDLCRFRGLTGGQGVLIPAANVQHLMLRQDVIEAVREERFHIYAVETIDQGMALLVGMAAGEADESGRFPAESLNGKVQRRLQMFAERQKQFARESQSPKKPRSRA